MDEWRLERRRETGMLGSMGTTPPFLIPYLLARWQAKTAYQRQRAIVIGLIIALILGARDMIPKIDSRLEIRETKTVTSQAKSLNATGAVPSRR
jgi:hypothetical protein